MGDVVEDAGNMFSGAADIIAPGASDMFSGAKKVKGFSMDGNLLNAEREMVSRQQAIASGEAPSISELQYKAALDDMIKNQQSAVASSRGVSNMGLLNRNAMMAGQQSGLDIARQSAASKLAEQRGADQMIAAQAASQRGVALQQSLANQQAETAYRNQNMEFVGNLASSASKMATGAAHGAVVPGEPIVEGDHPVNDTKHYKLSPGEIVIPRTAAKSRDSAIEFLDAIKFENEKSPAKKEMSEDKEGMAKLLQEMADLKKKVSKLEK